MALKKRAETGCKSEGCRWATALVLWAMRYYPAFGIVACASQIMVRFHPGLGAGRRRLNLKKI
jgi:hypothetical protein